MKLVLRLALITFAGAIWSAPALAVAADAGRGQRVFDACAPCHSLEPGRNMTGPSLADVWGRQAGRLLGFDRYSSAVKSSGIVWDDRSLDAWIADPKKFIPENHMTFPGIGDAHQRADLLAFLKEATQPDASVAQMSPQAGMGMMGSDQFLI